MSIRTVLSQLVSRDKRYDPHESYNSKTEGRSIEPVNDESTEVIREKKFASGTAGDIKLYDTPPRTAATLMAIIAYELKIPVNELRFISIREIKQEGNLI